MRIQTIVIGGGQAGLAVPGLYFVGLHFLYSMTSATLMGIGRDAVRVVKAIQLRTVTRGASRRRWTSITNAVI